MTDSSRFVKLTSFAFMKANRHYSGSRGGLQYSVDLEEDGFEAAVWPGPYCREQTDPAACQTARFALDEAGMHAAERWIEARYAAEPERWARAAEASILDAAPWQPPEPPGREEVKP